MSIVIQQREDVRGFAADIVSSAGQQALQAPNGATHHLALLVCGRHLGSGAHECDLQDPKNASRQKQHAPTGNRRAAASSTSAGSMLLSPGASRVGRAALR